MILTSLDGDVMRRYKKDFSAWLNVGRASRPQTLFSSLFEFWFHQEGKELPIQNAVQAYLDFQCKTSYL